MPPALDLLHAAEAIVQEREAHAEGQDADDGEAHHQTEDEMGQRQPPADEDQPQEVGHPGQESGPASHKVSEIEISRELTGTTNVVERVDSLYTQAAIVDGARVMGDVVSGGSTGSTAPPVYGLELAGQYGAARFQAEYFGVWVDQTVAPSVYYDGAYAQAGYFPHYLVAAAELAELQRRIDELEIEIDERVLELLALHQPMATDLRAIVAAFKINSDLERVGDHAVNIAQNVAYIVAAPPLPHLPELEEMVGLATDMLNDALDAFVRADSGLAWEIGRRDDRVDELHENVFRIVLTHMMEDPRKIGAGIDMILVSRNLERIADLATNVAEDVVFMVEGRTIKHHAHESHDARHQ